MKPVDWKEVLQTIKSSGSEKAAGLDGVSSDLVKILTGDSTEKPTPLLQSLVEVINISFRNGSSMVSWRKAIISMIPEKKDDGSFTDQISEMRPISVLQELEKLHPKDPREQN